MGVHNTRGHCMGNGGLRGHSVGEYFPCVIYQKGTPDALTHWVLQPNGVHAGPHATWDEAALAAQSYNNGGDTWPILSVEIRKVKLSEDESESWVMAEEVPFDMYGLYGIDADDCLTHLCDYNTWAEVRNAAALCVARFNDAGGVGHPVEYRELLRMLS